MDIGPLEDVLRTERAAAFRASGQWNEETLAAVVMGHTRRDPDRLAVVDRLGTLTYGELDDAVARLAGGLRGLGVDAGDVVSLQLPNWREYVIAYLATERLGAVVNPLLPQYREAELVPMQERIRSAVAVMPGEHRGHDYGAMWERVRERTGTPRHLLTVGGSAGPGRSDFWELLAASEPVPYPDEPWSSEDVALVLFTSGTVRAKGVVHAHVSLMHSLRAYRDHLGLSRDDVVWMPSPVGHATGLQWGVRIALHIGGTLVLQQKWDVDEAIDLVERHGVTLVAGATAFLHDLRTAARGQEHRLASLRHFVCAGAPIPPEMVTGSLEEVGIHVLRAFGMSEHFISTICHPDDPESRRIGTDGRCLPGYEAAVFDDSRTRILPPGEVGELAIRGAGLALGYLDEPAINDEIFRADGWQMTEDYAAIDEDGYVEIHGRRKDLIIRGGLNISPTEIESMLVHHPDIAEVAVIGLPDDRLGERICAVITTTGDRRPTLEELIDHLVGLGIAKTKLPEFLEVRAELPKTPSGKIRKNVLRDEVGARA